MIESNAAAVILFHNHPSSGIAEPSQADELHHAAAPASAATPRPGSCTQVLSLRALGPVADA